MSGNPPPPPPPPPGGADNGPPPMPTPNSSVECVSFETFKQVLMMSLIVCGFAGNILSILALWSERKKNTTSFLMTILAFTDQGVLICYLLLLIMKDFLKDYPVYSFYWIAFVNPPLSALQMAASWMVIQVSIHRFIIVCHPTKKPLYGTMKIARYQALFTMIGSILFTMPVWFEIELTSMNGSVVGFRFREEFNNDVYRYGYRSFFYYTAIFFIPIMILLYLTPKLIMTIKKAEQLREQLTARKIEKNKTTKSLIGIMLVFLVCQVLIPARFFVGFIVPLKFHMCPFPYYFVFGFTEIWAVFNSSINFVFYVALVTRFRNKLGQIFCPWKFRRVDTLTSEFQTTSNTSAANNETRTATSSCYEDPTEGQI